MSQRNKIDTKFPTKTCCRLVLKENGHLLYILNIIYFSFHHLECEIKRPISYVYFTFDCAGYLVKQYLTTYIL